MIDSRTWIQTLFDDVQRAVKDDVRRQPFPTKDHLPTRARVARLEMGIIRERMHELLDRPEGAQAFWFALGNAPKSSSVLLCDLVGMLAIGLIIEATGADPVTWKKVVESRDRDLFSLAFGLTHMGLVASGEMRKSSLVDHPMIQALYSERDAFEGLPSAEEIGGRIQELLALVTPREANPEILVPCLGYLAVILDSPEKAKEAIRLVESSNTFPGAPREMVAMMSALSFAPLIECFEGQPALAAECQYLRSALTAAGMSDPTFAAVMSKGKPVGRG